MKVTGKGAMVYVSPAGASMVWGDGETLIAALNLAMDRLEHK